MSKQLDMLGRSASIARAVEELATASDVDLGIVYTQEHLVERILDLCGYVGDDLHKQRILEPAVGGGAFLFPVLKRFLKSAIDAGLEPATWSDDLRDSVRAVEIHWATVGKLRAKLGTFLREFGAPPDVAESLVAAWVVQGDFLLEDELGYFDLIVGNPPYVRQERIAPELIAEYRRRYSTLYDRADLYVPFYEKSLESLTENGVLGFLCANRWIKNKYGGPLRELVHQRFHLLHYLDLTGEDVFDRVVDAYPAVTVIAPRKDNEPTTQIHQFHSKKVTSVTDVSNAKDPWLLDSPNVLSVIRKLEREFPALEDASVKVGIGVASGCDRVFIQGLKQLDFEESRRLPLAMASDVSDGKVQWSQRYLANPWDEEGLVDLTAHPRFKNFLERNSEPLKRRHVAKKDPGKWYKTIDRVDVSLTSRPKLLIPDIKGDLVMGYDPGEYYPHHNLYHLTSPEWDMRVVQALLKSSVAVSFVGAYAVRMAGGFLRFQAQYLRRIRVPRVDSLSETQVSDLLAVVDCSRDEVDEVVFEVYGLKRKDGDMLRKFARELVGGVHVK